MTVRIPSKAIDPDAVASAVSHLINDPLSSSTTVLFGRLGSYGSGRGFEMACCIVGGRMERRT